MEQGRRLLVVSAHSGDFVWRCSGSIAAFTKRGGSAQVIALSYGERGESGELWKQKDQTVENVKKIRHAEALEAAGIIGASFTAMDLGDYPLEIGAEAMGKLTEIIRDHAPDVIAAHADRDPFNPDHGVASAAAQRARMLATASNVASAFKIIRPPQLFLFEPHQTELCGYVPTTFVDITDVFDLKVKAMEALGAQSYLKQHYAERAEHRANHARRISGQSHIRYAETFSRVFPQIVETL